MKKSKFSYLLVFAFCFLCFSLNVNATDYSKQYAYDFFTMFDMFDDDYLKKFDEFMINYNSSSDIDYEFCSLDLLNYPDLSSSLIYCVDYDLFYEGFIDLSTHLFANVNYIMVAYNSSFDTFYKYNSGTNFSFRFFPRYYEFVDNNFTWYRFSYFFWTKEDFVYKGDDTVIFSDDVYSSMPDNYKKNYNFQNFISYDFPIYSIINLRLGDYVGVPIDADYTINYYYDNVLQENLTVTLSGLIGNTVTLNNLDDVKADIYFLDKSKDYSTVINAYTENVINVYYKSVDMTYNVNVYLDDIYYQSHSFVDVAKLGSVVNLDNLEESINIYNLDFRDYSLTISDNIQLNYIDVYYYSDNYDTKYQDIDTSNKFYISFDWVYIKELFKLNGVYTQTEQFIIVYVVNILFYVIVCIFGYFGLKMLYKLISFIKMF